MLRYVNYSRELIARGWHVYFAVPVPLEQPGPSREWFDSLKRDHIISDYLEIEYALSRRHRRLAAALAHPALANRALRSDQRNTATAVERTIRDLGIDILLLSNRRFAFLATAITTKPVIMDWADSLPLYLGRQIQSFLRKREWRAALGTLRPFIESIFQERYYGRIASLNIVVSGADKRALDRVTGRAEKNVVLLNGVTFPEDRARPEKESNRIIFSGNMSFPPNYEAALWFLDSVFPAVLNEEPGARLVLAGANPTPALLARRAPHVEITGYVEDMNHEIARSALYVAPLVSGGGFKNKVLEAIVNRTAVVGTPLAVEFLDPEMRRGVTVANSAEEMAECVVRLLRNPQAAKTKLEGLYERARLDFSWPLRTDELAALVEDVLSCVCRQ